MGVCNGEYWLGSFYAAQPLLVMLAHCANARWMLAVAKIAMLAH